MANNQHGGNKYIPKKYMAPIAVAGAVGVAAAVALSNTKTRKKIMTTYTDVKDHVMARFKDTHTTISEQNPLKTHKRSVARSQSKK